MSLNSLDPVHAALIENGVDGSHEVHESGIAAFVSQQHVVFSHSCNVYICSHPVTGESVLCTASCELGSGGPVFAAVYSGKSAASGAPVAHLAIWSSAAATPADGGHSDASVFFVRSMTNCELPDTGGLCSADAGDSLLRLCDVPGYPHVAFALAGSRGVLVAGLGPSAGGDDSVRAMTIAADGVDADTLFCAARCSGTDLLIAVATTTAARFIRLPFATWQAQEAVGALAWSAALSGGAVLEAAGLHWEGRCVVALVSLADGSHTLMAWRHAAQQPTSQDAAWRVVTPLPLAALPRFSAPLMRPSHLQGMSSPASAALGSGSLTVQCAPDNSKYSRNDSIVCSVLVSPLEDESSGWQLLQAAFGQGRGCLVDLHPPQNPEAPLVDAQLTAFDSLAVLLHNASGLVQLPDAQFLPTLGAVVGTAAGGAAAAGGGAQRVAHSAVEVLDDDESDAPKPQATGKQSHAVYQYLPPWLSGKLEQAMLFRAAVQGAAPGGGSAGGTAAAAQHALSTAVDVAAAAVLSPSATRGNVATALATAAATAAQPLAGAHAKQAQLAVASSVMAARPSARMLHNAREAVAAGSAFPTWAHAVEELLLSKTARLGLLVTLTRDVCGVPQALGWQLACLVAQWELLQQLTSGGGGGGGALASDQLAVLYGAMESCVAEWGISQEDMLRAGVSALLMFFAFSDRVRAVLDRLLLNRQQAIHAPGTTDGEAAAALLQPMQSLTARCMQAFVTAQDFTGAELAGGASLQQVAAWATAHWPVADLCAVALHAIKTQSTAQQADAASVAAAVACTRQTIAIASFLLKGLPANAPPLGALIAVAGTALSAANSANGVPAVLGALQDAGSALQHSLRGLTSLCSHQEELPGQVAALLAAACHFTVARGSPDTAASLLLAVAQVEWAAGGVDKPPHVAFLLGRQFAQRTSPGNPEDMLQAVLEGVAAQTNATGLDRVGAWCCHSLGALFEGASEDLPNRLLEATAAEGPDAGTAVHGDGIPAVHISGDAVTALSIITSLAQQHSQL